MNKQNTVYDFIGIGVGPFNLSLACLTDALPEVNSLFFDQADSFDWHPGMMLQSATLQTPFMCDLVTMADPTHPLSFLSYKKQQGKIYSFYIKESFYVLRKEYNRYCQWASEQVRNIVWSHKVKKTEYIEDEDHYCITVYNKNTDEINQYFCKKLVLGTGTSPYIPKVCEHMIGDKNVMHSSKYLENKQRLQSQKSITVVGSGQSAAEIYYDLLQDIDQYSYQLNWITRSPRFFPLELSKLTLEMTSPDYIDYFYALPDEKRSELIKQQKNLYKGINSELINDIFNLLYTKQEFLEDDETLNVNLLCNSELQVIRKKDAAISLSFYNAESDESFELESDSVILGTGYAYKQPEFLKGINSRIAYRKDGLYAVSRNYSIGKHQDIYIQNAELHTHGLVSPDLGMACYRNSSIIREITGKEHYKIEQSISFQAFGSIANESQLEEQSQQKHKKVV